MSEKEVIKPTSKARLRVYGEKSIIYRNEGYPYIEDKSTESVVWLERNGYKPAEIEVIGDKPSNWDAVFNPAPVIPEVVAETAAPIEATI